MIDSVINGGETPSTVRAFLACEIPPVLRDEVHDWLKKTTQRMAGIRWLGIDQIHLTLRFLGSVDEKVLCEVQQRGASVTQAYSPFTMEIKGVGVFASLRRPRIVWIGFAGALASLGALQSSLEEALQGLAIHQEEKRPFHPHLTIGRIRDPHSISGLESFLMNNRDRSFGTFEIKEITLFKSKLTPKGAEYKVIASFPLGGEVLRRQ